MLATQVVLTTLFLILTVTTTYRAQMQVLKCSSLATLCALDKETREQVGGIEDINVLKKRAKKIKVNLERGESGAALWLGAPRRHGEVRWD